MSMSDQPFVLLDRATRNFLGEFATFEEAEDALLGFVEAAPSAAQHLEIWSEDGSHLPVDPEKLRRVSAA